MGTWLKETIVIHLVASTTLADETSVTHVVQFQPIDQAFSAGAVSGTQGLSNLARYFPVSDLDTTQCYDIHIDSATTPIDRIFGIDTTTIPSE